MSSHQSHGKHDSLSHRLRANRRSLYAALGLLAVFFLVEIAGGLAANSLALLADAGHMFTDGAAIGLSLLAIWMSSRPASSQRTFGLHRSEILAALANAGSLCLIALWIAYSAIGRLQAPPEIHAPLTLVVGGIGLAVNVVIAFMLHRSAGESLNMHGAFLHVLGDLLGSVGVVTSAALIMLFGWNIADPLIAFLISCLILFNAVRLIWRVLHVLMESVPANLDLQRLCLRLENVDGVASVHDIHAWTITSGYNVLSAHVTARNDMLQNSEELLERLRTIAADEFGLDHVTFQLEVSDDNCVEMHHIPHDEDAASR
jgi:cobalt-zinc-cadmium efflux system protein